MPHRSIGQDVSYILLPSFVLQYTFFVCAIL